ncbi:MAG: hypothetical protein EBS53_10825, partial [Bacteroidetes bacterium]|nr:hypothetical protein [Bacteroidota bacterium]
MSKTRFGFFPGRVVFDAGNFEDYLAHKEKKDAELRALEARYASAKKPILPEPQKAKRSAKLSYKEEKELEGIESKILEAEDEAKRIEGLFESPDFYSSHGHEAVALQH